MLNIRDFGANVGTNNPAVDTNAFVDAIAALPQSGGLLYFPAGVYQINRRITIDRKRVVITGEGKGLTHLNWSAPAAGERSGILVTGDNAGGDDARPYFEIRSISLTTSYASDETAVRLKWTNGPADPRRKFCIRDVEIRPWNKYDAPDQNLGAWGTGISISHPGGLDISHTDIYGSPGIRSKYGIKIDAPNTATAIRHFLSNVYVYGFDEGIHCSGNCEGVYLANFEITFCGNGFTGKNGAVVYSLINGHIECFWNGARFDNDTPQDAPFAPFEVKIASVAFHQATGPRYLPGNMLLLAHAWRFNVANCSFVGNEGNGVTNSNGIYVSNGHQGLILGNHFDAIKANDIVFDSDTTDCHGGE